MIDGTSAVIDGMTAVIQRLAQNGQELTVEEEADLVQMKQAACALRELSKPEERSRPRSQPREQEEAAEARDKETHANGCKDDGGLQRQEKEPNAKRQRRRGESSDEGGRSAGPPAPHQSETQNAGPNTQDQTTKLKPYTPLQERRSPVRGASMKLSQRHRTKSETRLQARPQRQGKTELTRHKTRRQAGTGTKIRQSGRAYTRGATCQHCQDP